jgi:hypothetical protein
MLPHARIDNEIACFPAAVGRRKLRFYDRIGAKLPGLGIRDGLAMPTSRRSRYCCLAAKSR